MYRDDARPDRSVLVAVADKTVMGIDRTTGALLWQRQLKGYTLKLVVAEDRIFVAGVAQDGMTTLPSLCAIEYPTGRWIGEVALPRGHGGRTTMLFDEGLLFVGSSGQVSCFNRSGDLLWTHAAAENHGVSLGFPDNVQQVDY